jgi:hypothetical protein
MDTELIKVFGQVAGIGGLALGVFLLVAKELVRKAIFSALTKQQSSRVILALAFMAWTTALAGIGAWTYVSVHSSNNNEPEIDNSKPLSMALLTSETKPLDGYRFVSAPVLPAGLPAGVILPGGGRARLVLQAVNTDVITQLDRVGLIVSRHELADQSAFKYSVDPTRQSGFGAARPRRFYIRLTDQESAESFYVTDANATKPISLDNILVGTDFPLLLFDRSAGLQETLDFTFVASEPGFYDIRFTAHATSRGQEYELQSEPLYIVRH